MFEWDTDDYRAAQRAAYETIRAKHPDLVTVGFDCYAGWLPILDRFFDEAAAALAAAPGVKFELWQVKEKFGGLRIYYVMPRSEPPLAVDSRSHARTTRVGRSAMPTSRPNRRRNIPAMSVVDRVFSAVAKAGSRHVARSTRMAPCRISRREMQNDRGVSGEHSATALPRS